MDCFKVKPTKTLVRVFNALPINIPVDIYGDGILIFSELKYKDFTSYFYVPVGTHKVDIYKAGTKSNPIIRTSLRLPTDQIFTIAITGNQGEETLLVVDEDIEQQPSKQDAVGRTVNLCPNIEFIDLLFNDVPSLNNVAYRDETPYVFIPPGIYNISVKDGTTGNVMSTGKFEYKAERIYTLYIVGDEQNIQMVQSVDGNTYVCK